MEFKPAKPASIGQFSETGRRSNGCGCLGIGCLVVTIVMVLLCVGSYYTMMHTSLPLAFIKRALEENGDVRVDGLRGSISSGFEIDKLEFASDDPQYWNELRGVKFEFNGLFDLMRSQRLIIRQATIDSGTIYARFDESGNPDESPGGDWREFEWNIDGSDFAADVEEELNDLRHEMESEDLRELKEFRIDLIGATNIEIINPETDARLKFDQVEFSNFLVLDGQLESLGDIKIASDQLDLTTAPSTNFPEERFGWRLTGAIKVPMHQAIVADTPFDMDVALTETNTLAVTASFCDGALRIVDPWEKQVSLEMTDFSPALFLDLTQRLVPAKWNGKMVFESRPIDDQTNKADLKTGDNESPDGGDEESPMLRIVTVQPGASFQLGETRFEIQAGTRESEPGDESFPDLTATGRWNDQDLTAIISLRRQFPFVHIELSGGNFESKEIWSQLFLEKPYAELSADDQAEVDKAIVGPQPRLPQPVEF